MRTEAAVREKSDRAAAIIDSLDEPAFVLDETETIIHLNRGAAEILDIDQDRVIGHRFSDDIENHCTSCLRVRAAIESAGGFPSGEQQVELSLTVQGRDHEFLLKYAPLRESGGRALGTLVVLHDVSLRRERSRAHDTAVAAVAQQLNTPLTSLSLAAGLLQRGREEQNELIREIIEDVDRLNHASADFLKVVREQQGSIALQNVNFDLRTVFSFVCRKFEDKIERRKVRFAVHAEKLLVVSGDPLKLSWVIATLVGNAVRYTPEMGEIALTAEKEDDQIRISVWDSGPGIPPQTLGLVFGTPYPASADLLSVGTGISLAIAKEIVEAHGGRIFAETLESGGRVTLMLPLSRTSDG
jgi:PAS domain S-box-containing protein